MAAPSTKNEILRFTDSPHRLAVRCSLPWNLREAFRRSQSTFGVHGRRLSRRPCTWTRADSRCLTGSWRSKILAWSQDCTQRHQARQPAGELKHRDQDPQTYGEDNLYAGDIWSFGVTWLELYVSGFPFLERVQKPECPAFWCKAFVSARGPVFRRVAPTSFAAS